MKNKTDQTRHLVSRDIAQKGFRGMRKVVARSNISCTLIGNRPQSLTGHIVNSYKDKNGIFMFDVTVGPGQYQ